MANTVVQQVNAEMEELMKQLSHFKSTVEYLDGAKSNISEAVGVVHKAEENFNLRAKELYDTYHSFIKLSEAVTAIIQKIDTVNFPDRLDSIQSTVKETIQNLNAIKEATINEVQKAANAIIEANFDGRFSKLQDGINVSLKSNQGLADGIAKMQIPEKVEQFKEAITKRINESYKEVETNTRQIANDISKIILDLNLPVRIDKLDANIAGISSAVQNVQGRLDTLERNVSEKIKDGIDKQVAALSALQERVLTESAKGRKSQLINFIITWVIVLVCFVVYYFLKHK